MMHMLSKKIAVLPFVKKDENLEKRKERFFSGAKADAEGEIYHDVMKKIGYFQLQENNLNHLKGVQKAKEQGEIAKKIK